MDHCHLLATMMMKDGFKSREGPKHQGKLHGHDIPVVVRAGPSSPIAMESLEYWRDVTRGEPSFPRVTIDEGTGWFTSLGNGHFMQALNLFNSGVPNVFTDESFLVDPNDAALQRPAPHCKPHSRMPWGLHQHCHKLTALKPMHTNPESSLSLV